MRFRLFGKEINIKQQPEAAEGDKTVPQHPDREQFRAALCATQAYCQHILELDSSPDPATCLRNVNPVLDGHRLFSFRRSDATDAGPGRPQSETVWYHEPTAGNIHWMLKQRLDTIGAVPEGISAPMPGRVLLAEIDVTLHDGASEWESQGFIDIEDLPPIDTWFHVLHFEKRIFLCAWIPQAFVDLAEAGIRVNILESFVWLAQFSPALYRSLAL